MKLILTVSLLLFASIAIAQPAVVVLKTGEMDTVNIKSRTNNKITTSAGEYVYGEISTIFFEEKNDKLNGMYQAYTDKGITVRFTGQPIATDVPSPVIVNPDAVVTASQPGARDKTDLIVLHLTNFNKTRVAGKGLQMAGLVLSTLAAVSAAGGGDPGTVKAMGLIGGGLGLVGFITDISASSHLKKLELEYQYADR